MTKQLLSHLKVPVIFLLTATSLAVVLPSACADDVSEKILSFHGDLTVNPDGTMLVRETIRVRSAGEKIKRGIKRDILTRYTDRQGRQYAIWLDVLGVQRDKKLERFRVRSIEGGKRIQTGHWWWGLDPGEYTYTLTYKTHRAIAFFPDHDELYWHVTGNNWNLPVDQASAKVVLPKGIKKDALLLDAFTGLPGSVGTAYRRSLDADGTITFATTRALRPQEGLTILISWPKGFVAEPSQEMRFAYFLRDYRSTIISALGLAVLLLYCLGTWAVLGWLVARQVPTLLYEPPRSLSPALVRCFTRMDLNDAKLLSTAIISMAVKKFLTIREKDGVQSLGRGQASITVLTAEEKTVAEKLFAEAGIVDLTARNRGRIRAALDALKISLQLSLEKIHFRNNRPCLIPALAYSYLLLLYAALAEASDARVLAFFLVTLLTAWSLGAAFLLSQAVIAWKNLAGAEGGRAAAAGGALIASFVAIPVVGIELAGLYALAVTASVPVVVILVAIITCNYLFHRLLKRPDRAGKRLFDKIAGFKMFLAPPQQVLAGAISRSRQTPELFEKFLPYAMALDVEQEWSEQFSTLLAPATPGKPRYTPAWYSGASWGGEGNAGFAASLGLSLTSAVASSSMVSTTSQPLGRGRGGRS